jgi:hypothetical protein
MGPASMVAAATNITRTTVLNKTPKVIEEAGTGVLVKTENPPTASAINGLYQTVTPE